MIQNVKRIETKICLQITNLRHLNIRIQTYICLEYRSKKHHQGWGEFTFPIQIKGKSLSILQYRQAGVINSADNCHLSVSQDRSLLFVQSLPLSTGSYSGRQIHLVLYFKIQTILKLGMQTFSTFPSVS